MVNPARAKKRNSVENELSYDLYICNTYTTCGTEIPLKKNQFNIFREFVMKRACFCYTRNDDLLKFTFAIRTNNPYIYEL